MTSQTHWSRICPLALLSAHPPLFSSLSALHPFPFCSSCTLRFVFHLFHVKYYMIAWKSDFKRDSNRERKLLKKRLLQSLTWVFFRGKLNHVDIKSDFYSGFVTWFSGPASNNLFKLQEINYYIYMFSWAVHILMLRFMSVEVPEDANKLLAKWRKKNM